MEKIISSAEGDKLMLAIVDDITVCSKTSAIVEVISSVNPSPPPEVGSFFLNVSKTISFPTCLAGSSLIPDPTPSGMPEGVVCMKRGPPEKNGVRLLGSPIGSSEFKAQWIHDRIDSKLLPLLKQIEKFNQPHICLHLIRRSLTLLGLVHAARTTDPRSILPELERVDELILNALAKSVFCSNLSPAQKKLIQLPVSLGGWGFTSLKLIGLTGYIASLSTCLPQILALRPASAPRLQETLDSVVELLKKNYISSSVSLEARSSYTQKQLCHFVHNIQQATLLQETSSPLLLPFARKLRIRQDCGKSLLLPKKTFSRESFLSMLLVAPSVSLSTRLRERSERRFLIVSETK
jgi:hypothetical protein